MTRRSFVLGLAGLATIQLIATACGERLELGERTSEVDTPDAGLHPGAPLPDGDGGAVPDASASSSAGDLACNQTDSDACYDCCAAHHRSGASRYDDVFYTCICAPPVGDRGVCQAACRNSECAVMTDGGFIEAKANDECDQCEVTATDPGGRCVAALAAGCASESDCLAFMTCWSSCP